MPSDNAELEVTSASEWKTAKKQGQVIELPSGKRMRVKRTMSLMVLLKSGQIPNPLAGLVQDMISKGDKGIDMKNVDLDALKQLLALADETVLKAAVEPRVQDLPPDETDDDAISLEDIEPEDRMYIFTFAQGVAADLATFRTVESEVVARLSDGEGVQDDAGLAAGS